MSMVRAGRPARRTGDWGEKMSAILGQHGRTSWPRFFNQSIRGARSGLTGPSTNLG